MDSSHIRNRQPQSQQPQQLQQLQQQHTHLSKVAISPAQGSPLVEQSSPTRRTSANGAPRRRSGCARWWGPGLAGFALCVIVFSSQSELLLPSVVAGIAFNQTDSVPSTTLTESWMDARARCRHATNVRDIRACYPAQFVRQFADRPDCTTDIVDWTTVQRCLTGRFCDEAHPKPPTCQQRTIREVHIVGERNSGTKFITNAIQQCFPKPTVRVHRDFLRGKHFFQPITQGDYRSSLVVVIVRNPWEWMASMLEKPYHSPAHVAGFDATTGVVQSLDWRDFVSRPWAPNKEVTDPLRLVFNASLEHASLCRQEFTVREVAPCRLDNVTAQQPPWNIPLRKWRGYEPIYELRRDDSGRSYDHLLQLRADKMVNWILELSLLMRLGGMVVVRYEDVLERGNEFLMRQIASILQNPTNESATVPLPCSFTGPQPERRGKRPIPDDFREWIQQNMNAEMERLVGYQ